MAFLTIILCIFATLSSSDSDDCESSHKENYNNYHTKRNHYATTNESDGKGIFLNKENAFTLYVSADFTLTATGSVFCKCWLKNGEVFAKAMLPHGAHVTTFVADRITGIIVNVRTYGSAFTTFVTKLITVIVITVGYITSSFFATVFANLGAIMFVYMSNFCAFLATKIAVLVTAVFVAMLTTLTGKTTEVTLSIAKRRIFMLPNLAQGKALVALAIAGIIVDVVASMTKASAQIAGGVASVIIYVSYIADKTAIATIRITSIFKVVRLGHSFCSANVTFAIARIGINVWRHSTNDAALVTVHITFIGILMWLWSTLISTKIALPVAGIIIGMPCPVGYKSAEGAFSFAGVFNIMRYIFSDKSASFTILITRSFKNM